jgi:iron complex outermembrane recepter protein
MRTAEGEGPRRADCRLTARPVRGRAIVVAGCLIIGSMSATPALAAENVAALDITKLSLEDLMDIEVYSAARRLESWQATASAIYVLTADDIRRSHATSVPEALRLVPGVQVARLAANKWAVSIRGFNGRGANKLLVLIDGRTIYDPLFSGVLWESRDVMLEDIDRIEVIRGPGGTLWGANAVNGVINIITKHARDTQGGLISAGAGTEERGFGTARYGWQPGRGQHARIYARTLERDTGFAPADNAHDELRSTEAGFRWDWSDSVDDELRISADQLTSDADERASPTVTRTVDHLTRNLVARWTRRLSETESWYVQFYYDHIDLDTVVLGEIRDTYNVEFQHNLQPTAQQQLVWGAGYRRSFDDLQIGGSTTIQPDSRNDTLVHAFVQDTIALTPDRLQLTLGTKVEASDYADAAWQPNARLAWTPDPQHTWWASAGRAVRIPSRLEADLEIAGTRLGDDFDAETVDAFELGYRRLVTENLWYDVATFYNVYRNLLSIEQDFQFRNFTRARTYGLELAARWQATDWLRLDANYTYLQMVVDIASESTSNPVAADTLEQSSPGQQLVLRAAVNAGRNVEIDAVIRFVDELPALDVPAYTVLDLGLGWRPHTDLELSLVGQNLLDSHHPEQAITATGANTEVERGVFLKATWQF